MAPLSLKIVLDNGAVTRKVKFDTRATVREALVIVKEKVIVPEGKEYALFLRSADDDMSGVWLDPNQPLEYYMLRDGDSLDYMSRYRNLRVKLLDGSVKTLQVDEAKPVGELMMIICSRIGITNYDEYGLCHEIDEDEEPKAKEPATGTLTLKRKHQPKERDPELEQLSKKLKTDDYEEWLDQHSTLRELGVDPEETLLLKRRLFYTDRNVDSRDPVQLNLLYVQTRDAILNGRHLVTEQQAAEFAGIQCQIHFGDYQADKHKPGFIENLQEYLPEAYCSRACEKKILKAYKQHQGLSPLEAKHLYTKTARELPTYGVTFFLVKEKQKDKKKLVPRLLGINAEAILRLDEVTKEILQQWPLTHVKSYHVGKSETFTLNFGDYSDKEYSVKTQDALRIRDILEDYIDIIRRRTLAKHHVVPIEGAAISEENVHASKGTIIQCVQNNASKIITESFVGPTRIVPFVEGGQASHGIQYTTVQQIIVSDQANRKQETLKGEVAVRGDMPIGCVRKLNRMNSNSVKIVTLLTEPSDVNLIDAQRVVENMQQDLPDIVQGVIETAEKQSVEEARKALLEQLQELMNCMNKLNDSTKPGHINSVEAKENAENIADLTTQIYFSVDPKTRRRSEFIQKSRRSFIASDKSDETLRRASFIAVSSTASTTIDHALHALDQDYKGPKMDAAEEKRLEKSLESKIGKLNAALALYLTAHTDSQNIDYPAAINAMNTINELAPDVANDLRVLASNKDPNTRKELLDDSRTLFAFMKKLCGLTGSDDHERMQETSNQYADVSGKLIFTFSGNPNNDKENEIIEKAQVVGDKTSQLLAEVNRLTSQCPANDAVQELDAAGVKTAIAARDILATAQLTAPAIQEPHCRSALTASAESLASTVHHLANTWKPLTADRITAAFEDHLRSAALQVNKALDDLKDSYGDINDDVEMLDEEHPQRKRLKFINSAYGIQRELVGVEDMFNVKPIDAKDKMPPTDAEQKTAQRRLAQMLAQVNAALAALAAANVESQNPDYTTAELAVGTIGDILPQIVKDANVASSGGDGKTRHEIERQIKALCEASRNICAAAEQPEISADALDKSSNAIRKLLFMCSPDVNKLKSAQVIRGSDAVYKKSEELVSQTKQLAETLPADEASSINSSGTHTMDCAQALLNAARVASPSVHDHRCLNIVFSSMEKLSQSADQLTAAAMNAHGGSELKEDVDDARRELEKSLSLLKNVCEKENDENSPAQDTNRERQRLKFINSVAGIKERLHAIKDLPAPPCAFMKEADGVILQNQISDRIGRLNAAIAALNAALADRKDPDYEAAETAINTISELMPQIIEDTTTISTTKDGKEQEDLTKLLKELCKATEMICDNANSPKDLLNARDAAAKYSEASAKLKFLISGVPDNDVKKKIIDLAALANKKTSDLVSNVQKLSHQIDNDDAIKLDGKGHHTTVLAQALLDTALVTAPTYNEPQCKEALVSSANKLANSADQLTTACNPYLNKYTGSQKQIPDANNDLQEILNQLTKALENVGVSAEPEKERLKFINSIGGAKRSWATIQKELAKPVEKNIAKDDADTLKRRLSQKLGQLNATISALNAAIADRAQPNYVIADEAIKTIEKLMPEIVQDSRALAATSDNINQDAMLEELRKLCDATQEICDSSANPDDISKLTDAIAKYSQGSGKLNFIFSPAKVNDKEAQILDLASRACGRASDLLSHVHRLTQEVDGPGAVELDRRGAHTADSAQALLTTAQVTSPTIHETNCQKTMLSSVDHLSKSANELNYVCAPYLQTTRTRPLEKDFQDSHRQLQDALKDLADECRNANPSIVQERRKLKFINSAADAKEKLNDARKLLKKPMPPVRNEDNASLSLALSQKLAQLNGAIAALNCAVADRDKSDYNTADEAMTTITELIPQVIQDSRKLGLSKDKAAQAAIAKQLEELCEASEAVCAGVTSPEDLPKLSEIAAKYTAASGKLKFLISPAGQNVKEKETLELSSLVCGRVSDMLSHVHHLTEQVPVHVAEELDKKGASTADAAQVLLTTAQIAAPTMTEARCQKSVMASADHLDNSAEQLIETCAHQLKPNDPKTKHIQDNLKKSHQQLQSSLQILRDACTPLPHEQQKLQFVNSITNTKNCLDAAEKQLKQPVPCSLMTEEDAVKLQLRLSDKLAQLNASIAALKGAVSDPKNPDYTAANNAIRTITELIPQVVQDTRKTCSIKDDATQKQMIQELQMLCNAGQCVCSSVEKPQDLNQAAAKFSEATDKLNFLVNSGKDAKQGLKTKPQVPKRADHTHTIAQAVPSNNANITQDFLHRMRLEESQASQPRSVTSTPGLATKSDGEKRLHLQFAKSVESAGKELLKTEEELKKQTPRKTSTTAVNAVEIANKEEQMEESLAKASVQVAALISANYADKIDYGAASKPVIKLPQLVQDVVKDGKIVSTSLGDRERQAFLNDMLGLCQSTRNLCDAAENEKEKLNDSAIKFGNYSSKLLRVVSTDVNSALEKELISRAKVIGDTASRLAYEVGNVVTSEVTDHPGTGDQRVQGLCTSGMGCVDTAGKLVYTAKCVAPTIHLSTCQDTLISSADGLSSSLEAFSKTWEQISDRSKAEKLSEEARKLEKLLEELKRDVRAGKLGKKWEVDAVVVLDTPLKKLTQQIIEDAENMAECTDLKADQKTEYANYARRLEDALRALDLANARCQRSPHNKTRRQRLEEAIQDLQVELLQTRPKRTDKQQNNVVDLRDFLQDLAKEADTLQESAVKNETSGSKNATEDIKANSSKISEGCGRLLNPDGGNSGEDTTLDDILEIDTFGQECEKLIKDINSAISSIDDKKASNILRNKALPLRESCNMLRFATSTALSTAQGAAYDGVLNDLDDFETSILKSLVDEIARNAGITKRTQVAASPRQALESKVSLQRAACAAGAGEPRQLPLALTRYAAHVATQPAGSELAAKDLFNHLSDVTAQVKMVTGTGSVRAATWDTPRHAEVAPVTKRLINELNLSPLAGGKPHKVERLNETDLQKLLLPCDKSNIEGTEKQLEDKLQQLSTKLSSMSSMIFVSFNKPESLARSLKATADAAMQLSQTARALQDKKKPVEGKRIEEACREMCFETYSLLKTSELASHVPSHPDSRKRLLDACRLLNDAINKLVRSANSEVSLDRECSELARSIQLQQSAAQGYPQPGCALPYADCVDTLLEQRDIIQKLNNPEAMSKQEFLNTLSYVASAVNNSSECASHCAYLISISESDETSGKEGIVDVPKLHKMVSAAQDGCVGIIKAGHEEQVKEERIELEKQMQQLLECLDEAENKTKATDLKSLLKHCKENLDKSWKSLCVAVDKNSPKGVVISESLSLLDNLNRANTVIEHPKLVPTAEGVSADTQVLCDEVQKNSKLLLSKTQDLIREVKTTPDEPDVMKWVMFSKKKDVLDAFEALLKSVRSSGQRVRLLQSTVDEEEGEPKTYLQTQVETAFKWLAKPFSKADVKSAGQQSVSNIIRVANQVAEDLKDGEKEELKHLIVEGEQLLKTCSAKYNQEEYSVLMDRLRELQKVIERAIVTRVVEDFMDEDAPLADLDILADSEPDEKKRKFLLEKKIAELLAHLGRVNRTARFIADASKGGKQLGNQLSKCSQQTELLAPMLVKAAEARINSPNDQVALENYKSLLAKYSESLAKVRDLCDRSVDPMDFVQTASDKMQRMREESCKHHDPMKRAQASFAINKLANRVIHVSMASTTARDDPELHQALTEAQEQLSAATPPSNTRASKMPDWETTTAKILRTTEEVESALGGENIFKKLPEPNQPIYNEALNLHVAIRDWSSRDNEIVAVAKRMAVLMAKLSDHMDKDKQRELLVTSKSIVTESHEVARLAKKLAHECTDLRIKTNLLQACERIPTISAQLKMLTTVKGSSLGHHGTHEDKEAMDMLVGNAQSLMSTISEVVKAAASASVKIMSQRGPRMKWVRKTYY